MSDEEQKEIKEATKTSKFNGETNCIIETLPVLLRTSRGKLSDRIDEGVEKWILTAWKKDGLAKAWQTQFSTDAVPQLDEQDDYWKNGEYLAPPLREAIQAFKFFLVKAMYPPFLSLDGKGVLHGIEEAEPQCARTGAAMVFHLLQFLDFLSAKLPEEQQTTTASSSAMVPQPAAPGTHSGSQVDHDAIAFTIAFSPSKIHLFVHFAEKPMDTPTCYHMHDVGSYDLKKGEDIALLRKHINNILDWGLGERKAELERRCQSLSDSMRLAKKRKA
ncbi:MAG: hypothetical protein Q9172_001451 [Xanthocarpia lactea]